MTFKHDFRALFGAALDNLFAMALTRPDVFHGAARPILLSNADGDVIKAQSLALEGMREHQRVVHKYADQFVARYAEAGVLVPVAGRRVTPVGTAAGVDPHADNLDLTALLFGLQMPGPVALRPREVLSAPFQEDSGRGDLFVPLLFETRGLEYFQRKLIDYRQAGGDGVVLPAVVALAGEGSAIDPICSQLAELVQALELYADGFVWMPALAGSAAVMSESVFGRVGTTMAAAAPGKLHLVEMPAWPEDRADAWLRLVAAFLAGGGSGVVAVGGLEVPCARLPQPDRWPFPTAIQCGASMAEYRQRAIQALRGAFPGAFIAACGGFHSRDEAFRACQYANVIVENEAYTRFGPGMARVLLAKLADRLKFLARSGELPTADLEDYQRRLWSG